MLSHCHGVAIKLLRCSEWLSTFCYVIAREFWVVAKIASYKGVAMRLLRCSEWLSTFCYVAAWVSWKVAKVLLAAGCCCKVTKAF